MGQEGWPCKLDRAWGSISKGKGHTINVRFATYPHQFSFIWSGPWLKAHCLPEKINVAHAPWIFKHSNDALPSASTIQCLETQIQIFKFFKTHLTHLAVHASVSIPASNFLLSDPLESSLKPTEHCSHSSPPSRPISGRRSFLPIDEIQHWHHSRSLLLGKIPVKSLPSCRNTLLPLLFHIKSA